MRKINVNRKIKTRVNLLLTNILWIALTLILSIVGLAENQSPQNSRINDYTPDKALKSNARINPMSRAMELSIPIGGYQGRGGSGLPITFDYSSKVWQIDFLYTWLTNEENMKTDTQPVYAKTSAAGWTSSLGVPRIIYPHNLYTGPDGNGDGRPYNPGECYGEDCASANFYVYYIKRIEVAMPDGSTVEFRKDDTAHLWGTAQGGGETDMTGNFLSVDGSRMRLEITSNQKTLFLSDGSRYLFGAEETANTFIDRNGNKRIYNPTTKFWTDTMGRAIENPIPLVFDGTQQTSITVGDKTVGFPSKDGGTFNVTLSWRYLKDPQGGESGLTNPNQDLAYLSDQGCQGNLNRWISTAQNPQPHLFKTGRVNQWDHFTRVCHPITWEGLNWTPGARFNPKVLTKITLPNGQSYQFKYNIYGEIEKVIYPTGAYERFVYGEVPVVLPAMSGHYDQGNRGVLERWVSAKGDGTDEQHSTYNGWLTIAPDGTQTKQLFVTDSPYNEQPYGFGNSYLGKAYEEQVLSPAPANQMLRRKLTSYEKTGAQTGGVGMAFRDVRPNKEVSIIFEPNNNYALAQMTETVYDTNSDPEYFASLNPKQIKTYNYIVLTDLNMARTATIETISALFSSSNLAVISEIDYLYDANYKARNINGLVSETRIKDAAGNTKAKSQIFYDEAGSYPIIDYGTATTNWETPNTNFRGNPTTTRSWSDVANNQYVESHAQFDQFGNLRKSWDGRGNVSEIQYTDNYADNVNRNSYAFPTKTISAIPDTSGQNGANSAFETTVKYDFNTGLPISTTDLNNQTMTVEYNDALLRPTKMIAPNGHQTITEYGAGTSEATRFVKVKTQIDNANWKEGYSWFDGLGRSVKSQSVDSNGDVFALTCYDQYGRVEKVSNPFRNVPNANCQSSLEWTANTYDTTGRVWKITTPDGAFVETTYGLATSGASIGTTVTVTDQAGKLRRSITNSLGQLSRVDEPNDSNQLGTINSPNQATLYSYDILNNLTTVTQGVQTRNFAYDSLSRLKQAENPESGTISYTYDNNGNLTSKTDARQVVTNYVYDNLNRVTQRNYSAPQSLPNYQATPNASYFYDDVNVAFSKGKLTKVSSAVSETKYTQFDNVGRVLSSQQITDGQTYTSGYLYNLSGALIEETYPSGRVVKNTLDTDGSLQQVQSKKVNDTFKNYANSFNYTTAGAVSSMRLGNGRWENMQFNSRLQPTQIGLGTSATNQSLLKLNYDYGTTDNNGNVKSQIITVERSNQSPLVLTQSYVYDSLNRLKSAEEKDMANQTMWKQTYTFDRYGNRRFDQANTTAAPASFSNPNVTNPQIDTANNRFTTGQNYTYDLAGNLLTDAEGRTFTYDAENKQKTAANSGGTIGQYFYDGDGKRVKKTGIINGQPEETIFVYDAFGKLVAEYSTVVSTTPKIQYQTNDHLGTPRINTNELGAVVSRSDYMPYGEEVVGLGGRNSNDKYISDDVRQGFSGYIKDDETGLDFAEARMYAKSLGRFTTTDPLQASASAIRPQSWNRYSYSYNSPLRFADPTGMAPGDYVDQDGYKIGSDGEDTKTLYFVPNEADRKTIIDNTKRGNTTDRETVTALELPNADVRQEIANAAVKRTKDKTTDDKKGGFHEDGGAVYQAGKGQLAVPAKPGALGTPGPGGEANVNVLDPANPNLMEQVTDKTPLLTYHVHPGGLASKARGGENGGVIQSLQGFQQNPSERDLANYGNKPSKFGYNIVVGAGSKTIMNEGEIRPNSGGQRVTFYNSKILGSMSLEGFLKAGRTR